MSKTELLQRLNDPSRLEEARVLGAERNYYRQRAQQESAAAESASSPQARRAHRELADRYASKLQLLDSISSGTPFPPAVAPTGSQAA
jgi:hypothetical protein